MSGVGIAVGVLCAISAVCAIILVIAAKYMFVPVDETVTKIRECLPGANCGACGYAGCDNYASELAEGNEEKTNKCIPGGDKVAAQIADCVHVMGENTQLARVAYVEADGIVSYIHMGGKIGVLVEFELENIDPTADAFVTYGRDVAMQVAAMSPVSANRDAVPADVVAREMAIYKAQAADSGKPEAIQEKIATGRMEKFYAENCLTEQAFVKDNDLTVQAYTDKVAKELGGSIKVADFVRYALGE